MAKLHNYHVLCPLIDQKSFLGVSPDKEEEDVIVTLGRNVVNKYRLSDQKQIGGWTSRDHITSAVIYDKDQESYVGVFNNNIVKKWNDDADNLDKLKKYKFPINIHKLLLRKDKPSLIVFSNGNCAALPYAVDNRKTYESKSFIKESETIEDIACYSINGIDHVCYVVKNSKDLYEIITCPIREELGDLERSKLDKTKVTRPEDVFLVGQLISTTDKIPSVYILWSDSKISVYDLIKKSWKTAGTVPWASTISQVSMAAMGRDHIVVIGSNTDQDGAIMVAYNVFLGVGSCKYAMKMHSESAKLYCINNRIILEAPNHIGMLPYVLETKRNLSSLMGSHEIVDEEQTEIAKWEEERAVNNQFDLIPQAKELARLGLPERTICSQIITPLLEQKDTSKVFAVIREFKDIPESVIVQLLKYSIKSIELKKLDITNHKQFVRFCLEKKRHQGFELINVTFEFTFSDALLIPCMRNGLTLNDALFLLRYISYLLVDSDTPLTEDYESKLLDWCTLLIDSFYQQYLMTKDTKVTFVLRNTMEVVLGFIRNLNDINNTMSVLHKLLIGNNTVNEPSLPYIIEMMSI